MEYCLTTEALCKTYRQGKALHNVTMHVPKGAIYGFVGKNGAGKTTLIRLICGLQAPTAGGYTLYGVRNTDPSIHRVRRRMGAVVESPAIYLDLTAEDNLRLQARLATHYGFLDQGTLVREVSAQELEAACRRCVRLTVTDAKTLCRMLDGRGLEYRLAGEGEADVYEAHDLSQLILDLHQAGCQVTGLHQRDETLESYYMNLVGGGRDV